MKKTDESNDAYEYMNEETKKLIKKNGVVFLERNKKYTKRKFLRVYQEYNFLELLYPVRYYIQKKHNITINILEMLLFLQGRGFFSNSDYKEMPTQFKYSKIKKLIDLGHIEIAINNKHISKHVYTVSTKSRRIIEEFYELLSGERKLPCDSKNILISSNTSKYEKRVLSVLKKAQEKPIPDSKRKLFE